MSKKIIAVILAVLMLATVLAACGNSTPAPSGGDKPAPSNNTPADNGKKEEGKKEEEPAKQEYTQTYALKYSSYAPEGHPTNVNTEVPLKEFIEKESNGRITVDIYSAGALTSQGSTLEGIMNGVTDMGYDAPAYYAGVYPYVELMSTPGLYYGDEEQLVQMFKDYMTTYPSENLDANVYLLAYQPMPTFYFTSQKPLTTWEDIQGFSVRVTADKVSYFEAIGCAPVVISTADIYEAIRLNVITGSLAIIQGINTTSIYELCDYATAWYPAIGMTGWYFSKEVYDSMDPEAQAVMDKARDLMDTKLGPADNEVQLKIAEEVIYKGNPNFTLLKFDEECVQKMAEAGAPVLENKAAELDAMGLDGTGALEWLRARSLPVPTD